MSMQLPNLDDRRWADLVDESRAVLPLYAPEWTDHNAHDPGITLVELLAWLAEMDLYQLNRITAAQRRKFLRLVGLQPEPPRAARSVLAFTLAPNSPSLLLPADIEFEGKDALGTTVVVRTLDAITVVAGKLAAIHVDDGQQLVDQTTHWLLGEPFPIFGADPRAGAAVYFGLDSDSLGLPVSLEFTVTDPEASAEERRRLIEEADARHSECQRPEWLALCNPERLETPDPLPTEPPPSRLLRHHSARLRWEYYAGSGQWFGLENATEDRTRAFTLNGRVVLRIPGAMGKRRFGHDADELYYLRCRMITGAYDAAPSLLSVSLNGVEVEQAAVTKQATHTIPPSLQVRFEKLGHGTGRPNQRHSFSQNPVLAASVQLFTKESGEWYRWHLCSDFDGSGPADRHAVLDATQGVLSFGDGNCGWVPDKNDLIFASFLTTLADKGNLPAGSITELSRSSHNHTLLQGTTPHDMAAALATIANPVPLAGGASEETLEHAEGRAFLLAEKTLRAVTLSDYESLAAQAPGVCLGRVSAFANVHPDFPCIRAPGVVTVIVVPRLPVDRPVPSDGLLRAVEAYLLPRRAIGTRVVVVGPTYVEVAVRAKIHIRSGASMTGTPRLAAAALERFFHPLTGGPDGTGWPLGRGVVRAEVLAVISQTPGVDHVDSMELLVNGGPPQCGKVCLGFGGLIAPARHEIEMG